MLLGHLTAEQFISINDSAIRLDAAQEEYLEPLQEIFPYKIEEKAQGELNQPLYRADLPLTAPVTLAKPRVFIPVFRDKTANMTVPELLKKPVRLQTYLSFEILLPRLLMSQ